MLPANHAGLTECSFVLEISRFNVKTSDSIVSEDFDQKILALMTIT